MTINLTFRSGMSSLSDLHGAMDAGVPVGVVAGKLSVHQLLGGIPRYLDKGGKCFVDSGAFTTFKSGETMNWPDIIKRYTDLAELTFKPQNLYVVSPDVVGAQPPRCYCSNNGSRNCSTSSTWARTSLFLSSTEKHRLRP